MDATRIAGRYEPGTELGSGGEARVFRARDAVTGREVALRIAHGSVRAAVIAPPALPHEGWVRLLDAGTDAEAGAYQVFELLEGRTLADVVPGAPLNAPAWSAFVDQSLAAVEAVHAAGWVHGDLNADNFFLTAGGWKLLELPWHRLEPEQPRSPMFGSIYTLAPEQINGAAPDARSDLYALGCLYYYAAAGRWPHTGRTVQEVAISALLHTPTELREAAPGLRRPGPTGS